MRVRRRRLLTGVRFGWASSFHGKVIISKEKYSIFKEGPVFLNRTEVKSKLDMLRKLCHIATEILEVALSKIVNSCFSVRELLHTCLQLQQHDLDHLSQVLFAHH